MDVYQPHINPLVTGLHIPYDQGYDAKSRAKVGTADDHDASGYLSCPNLGIIHLWITEVTADFLLNGSKGQSRIRREFFPRSFQDVTLTVSGNVPSTREYNRLAAFVRESQWAALNNTSQDQMVTFHLNDQTPSSWKPSGNVKGRHRPWDVTGYIPHIEAGAICHEVAPEFTFGFVVTASPYTANTNLWNDIATTSPQLRTMLQLINATKGSRVAGRGFVSNPDAPANSAIGIGQSVGAGAAEPWSVAASFINF